MRTLKIIHTLSCHAEGEVGDVIINGVEPCSVQPVGLALDLRPRQLPSCQVGIRGSPLMGSEQMGVLRR